MSKEASRAPEDTYLPTPPTSNPAVAEGTGFSGMPYPTHGVELLATEPPMPPPVSEPVAFGSSYVGIHELAHCPEPGAFHRAPVVVCPLPMLGYTMREPGFTSLSGVRGPESCGGRSRGFERSSNRSLTRSEIKEALRGATANLVGDLTQEIGAELQRLIPPQGSPVTIGALPHEVQANHLVFGLAHKLGGVRSKPMLTSAAVQGSALVLGTEQPPDSHVEIWTHAKLDRPGLTTLRAMVDVQPYASSDVGRDPSKNKLPSLSPAPPSDDDAPEDLENPSDKKKEKHERRCSKEAKAISA